MEWIVEAERAIRMAGFFAGVVALPLALVAIGVWNVALARRDRRRRKA